jgi:hypothetical protein
MKHRYIKNRHACNLSDKLWKPESSDVFITVLSTLPSSGVKQSGHETDHSPPSSAEVKNAWSYTSTHPIRLHGVVLN